MLAFIPELAYLENIFAATLLRAVFMIGIHWKLLMLVLTATPVSAQERQQWLAQHPGGS